jgi:glycosyltransferase involved in cell wall biosynthesis
MKTKVIQFIPTLNDGGAEALVRDYVINLDTSKFSSSIITLRHYYGKKTATYKTLSNKGFIIHKCYLNKLYIKSDYNFIKRVYKKFFDIPFVASRLKRIIKKEKPRVIHVHLDLLKYIKPLSHYLNNRHIKLFYTCHSLPSRWLGKNTYPQEWNAASKLIIKNRLQIIALHEQMKSEINYMFNINNVIVLNNGIDFKIYKKTTKAKKKLENH